MTKRTKIVCTLGPATSSKKVLIKMIKAGMNVARLNFSHGTYDDHQKLIANVRSAMKDTKTSVALLQDLQGPRIRIGDLGEDGVLIKRNQKIILVPNSIYPKLKHEKYALIPIQYEKLYRDVKPHTEILIEDGKIRLEVVMVKKQLIYCVVKIGDVVKAHKGINVPGITLTAEVITPKDRRDVEFGVKNGVHYIALSFVKDAGNIKALKKLIAKYQKKSEFRTKVIAKIERREALDNIDEIMEEVDGIMVARGDLGLEIHPEEVPIWQKKMIMKCLRLSKPIIVATQMLDSMVSNLQPTRAEVSDVATAVVDHTDAVMLSAESAVGKYPVQTVNMMANICRETEESLYDDLSCSIFPMYTVSDSFRESLCQIAATNQIKAICLFDNDGDQTRKIARYRPELDIIVFTNLKRVSRQLALVKAVTSFEVKKKISHSLSVDLLKKIKKNTQLKKGDNILFVSSVHGVEDIDLIQLIKL